MSRRITNPLSDHQVRKAKGVCAHCSSPSVGGRVNCEECRVKYNLVSKQRSQTWKAAGACMKCGCLDLVQGLTVCARCRLAVRLTALRQKGLSETEIERARQAALLFNGICQCCGNINPKCRGIKEWAFDHDHVTLQFRAIVGTGCNAALGLAGDSSAVLTLMSEYLERYR